MAIAIAAVESDSECFVRVRASVCAVVADLRGAAVVAGGTAVLAPVGVVLGSGVSPDGT